MKLSGSKVIVAPPGRKSARLQSSSAPPATAARVTTNASSRQRRSTPRQTPTSRAPVPVAVSATVEPNRKRGSLTKVASARPRRNGRMKLPDKPEMKRKRLTAVVIEEEDGDGGPKKRKVVHKKLPCAVCGQQYYSFYLKTHMRKHTGEKPFRCECDKQFSTMSLLTTHRRRYHTRDTRDLRCEQCHLVFASKGSLTVHRRVHSTDRPFVCKVCAKNFKQLGVLKEHMKTHTKIIPYNCDVCSKPFRSKRSLTRHRETEHEGIRRDFNCPKCEKVFHDRSSLFRHKKRHLDDYEMMACDVCDRRFHEAKVLKTHMLIHLNVKPFSCNVCGQKFRHQSVLQRHTSVHTGIKPFRCDKCQRQFNHRVHLLRHRRCLPRTETATDNTHFIPSATTESSDQNSTFRMASPAATTTISSRTTSDARAAINRKLTYTSAPPLIPAQADHRHDAQSVLLQRCSTSPIKVECASPSFAPIGPVPRFALPGRTGHLAASPLAVPRSRLRRQVTPPRKNGGNTSCSNTDNIVFLFSPLPSGPCAVKVSTSPGSGSVVNNSATSFLDLGSVSYSRSEQNL